MPRIKLVLSKEKYSLISPKNRDFINLELIKKVSANINEIHPKDITTDCIELIWDLFEKGIGNPDLVIEVIFSTSTDYFDPSQEVLSGLNGSIFSFFGESILKKLPVSSGFIPDKFAVWIMPISRGVWRLRN